MQPQTQRQPGHPVLDEQAFQQLLSAAYVMQEHNARLKKAPKPAISGSFPAARPTVADAFVSPTQPVPAANVASPAKATCPACGQDLADEPFCIHCGTSAHASGSTLRKNWASLWELHHAATPAEELTGPEQSHASGSSEKVAKEETEIDLFPAELEEIVGKFS